MPADARPRLRLATMRNGRLYDAVIMPGEPTVIYSADNVQQAYLLKGLLEEQGIFARVVNDAIQIASGDLPLGWTSAAKVVVPDQDAPAARRLAEEFDRQTAHEPLADDKCEASVTAPWESWPVCPECGERRSARCPICHTSGSKFELADLQESASGERVLLYCPNCDDHFRPEWYRLCARCGHDFGEGIQVAQPAPVGQLIGLREWFVVVATTAFALAMSAYFVWLFSAKPR